MILGELNLPETKKNYFERLLLSKNYTNITLEEIINETILQDVMSIV